MNIPEGALRSKPASTRIYILFEITRGRTTVRQLPPPRFSASHRVNLLYLRHPSKGRRIDRYNPQSQISVDPQKEHYCHGGSQRRRPAVDEQNVMLFVQAIASTEREPQPIQEQSGKRDPSTNADCSLDSCNGTCKTFSRHAPFRLLLRRSSATTLCLLHPR